MFLERFNPNSKTWQAKQARLIKELAAKLKRLARYPEYDAYIHELEVQREVLIDEIKMCKDWNQYLEVRSKLTLLEGILENSTDHAAYEPTEEPAAAE